VEHVCTMCPAGKWTSAAYHDASGLDTECDHTFCGFNQKIRNHVCTACPPGTTSPGNLDATGEDTTCEAQLCGPNFRVVNHVCLICPEGQTSSGTLYASGIDTACDLPIEEPTVLNPFGVQTTTAPRYTGSQSNNSLFIFIETAVGVTEPPDHDFYGNTSFGALTFKICFGGAILLVLCCMVGLCVFIAMMLHGKKTEKNGSYKALSQGSICCATEVAATDGCDAETGLQASAQVGGAVDCEPLLASSCQDPPTPATPSGGAACSEPGDAREVGTRQDAAAKTGVMGGSLTAPPRR